VNKIKLGTFGIGWWMPEGVLLLLLCRVLAKMPDAAKDSTVLNVRIPVPVVLAFHLC
jgi:hypothetical protein